MHLIEPTPDSALDNWWSSTALVLFSHCRLLLRRPR